MLKMEKLRLGSDKVNIEEIRKRTLADIQRRFKEYKNLENIPYDEEDAHRTNTIHNIHGAVEHDYEFMLSIIEQQSKVLELIANGNNDFPTWSDAVDVLIDVRVVAKEALQAIRK